MLKKLRRMPALALVLLGIICGVGVILSGQRYFLHEALEDALKTQMALDESFLVAVSAGAVGPNASQAEFAKAVVAHLEQTGEVRRAVRQLNANIGMSEMLSTILLIAASVILVFLIIGRREASDRTSAEA